jgi:trimethylamine--corrinoid protein Co-methyltransferase
MAHVHQSALQILSSIGVRIDSEQGRQLFARASGVTLDGDRVRIPPELVERALETAPSTVDIYDQRGEFSFRLGIGEAHFGVGVTALYYQDPGTNEVIPFAREHFRSAVRLGNALSSFDTVSTVGIIQDLSPQVADLYAVLEMTANTIKPLVTLVSDEHRFGDVIRLLVHLHDDLASRPFVVPYFNPITPLVVNAGTLQKMLVAIEHGLPLIYSNYGMIGATTPITSAGTLALLNAELLVGLTLSQLVKEGTPVILGSLPASFDMKRMGTFYRPQGYLVSLACAEMMEHYGLPHCGTSGSGVGWGPGLVAAGHQWMNHLIACASTMELVPFVGDVLGARVFSPAVVVYADDVVREARSFAGGFELSDASIGLEDILEVGPGGTFLNSARTFELFRDGYHQSNVLPELMLEQWQARGCPRAEEVLRHHTRQLIADLRAPADHGDLIERGEAFCPQPRTRLVLASRRRDTTTRGHDHSPRATFCLGSMPGKACRPLFPLMTRCVQPPPRPCPGGRPWTAVLAGAWPRSP